MRNTRRWVVIHLALLCIVVLAGNNIARAEIQLTADVRFDQTRGFYYVVARLYSNIPFKVNGKLDSTQYAANQNEVASFFTQYQDAIKLKSSYTVVDSADAASAGFNPGNVERVKLLPFSRMLLSHVTDSTAHPEEIVVFFWVILKPNHTYMVSFKSESQSLSDPSGWCLRMNSVSYVSPLEVANPVQFDVQPAGGAAMNFHVGYSAVLTNLSSDFSSHMQVQGALNGQRVSADLSDSLSTFGATLGGQLRWAGAGPLRSFGFDLSAEANGQHQFKDYDVDASLALTCLFAPIAHAEAMTLSVAGSFVHKQFSDADTSGSNARFTASLDWYPKWGSVGFDLEGRVWLDNGVVPTPVSTNMYYYYRALMTVQGLPYVEPFLGFEQGYLLPAFQFAKRVDVGVRVKIPNSTSS